MFFETLYSVGLSSNLGRIAVNALDQLCDLPTEDSQSNRRMPFESVAMATPSKLYVLSECSCCGKTFIYIQNQQSKQSATNQ